MRSLAGKAVEEVIVATVVVHDAVFLGDVSHVEELCSVNASVSRCEHRIPINLSCPRVHVASGR